ncbi:MAG TPA: SDR family NAD(P)-dependent oxidoreductase, partial [Chloroflexi bacterium]|nr:SDR family NAD(P)-dependent oxidoreductase [Chloroflexota bacterium]
MMKVVIVTGANQGIGYAMTQQLLADGYRIAAFDIEDDQLKALKEQYPDSLRVYVCDVTDREQVNAAVADVAGQWGGVDVLVNNAVLAVFEPFETR